MSGSVSLGSSSFRLTPFTVFVFLLLGISSSIFARYLGWGILSVLQIVLFAISTLSLVYIQRHIREISVSKLEFFLLCIFCFFFSASIVIGYHVVIGNQNAYGGLVGENYLSPFGLLDVLAFFAVYLQSGLAILSIHVLFRRRLIQAKISGGLCFSKAPVKARLIFQGFCLIALLWLPYLFACWPGFIFSDTISSITQATGDAVLTNHHPVAYTLFIRIGLSAASALGFGKTSGLALCNCVQMLFMAATFAYSAAWANIRFNLPKYTWLFVSLFVGLTPSLGAFSIAMWKDPIFTSCFLLVSMCLCDLALSHWSCAKGVLWNLRFFASSIVAMLMRNNGMYVIAVVFLVLFVLGLYRLFKSVKSETFSVLFPSLSLLVSLVVYFVVTGPVFASMGVVPTESVEALGVPLNQMARVVALDGDMTQSDREYMDKLLPLEKYKDVYTPCCTDSLKWNPEFDGSALSDGFFSHWLSILRRNPRICLDSWILQTFGFWTVNSDPIFRSDNIGAGVPRIGTNTSDVNALDLYPQNLTHSDAFENLLEWNSLPIPVGFLFWIFMFVLLELSLCALRPFCLMFLPSAGVLGTLLIASPIWYWARYSAILNFMLPVLVCFLAKIIVFQNSNWTPCKDR